MSSRRCRYGLVTLLMVGLLLVIVPIQGAIHEARPKMFNPERKTVRRSAISIGPTPAVVAALGGFRTVAADLLWLKAERVWHGGDWWMMLPILDAVTQLDPQFLLAWKVYGWHAAYNLHGESQTLAEKNWWLDHGVDALERYERALFQCECPVRRRFCCVHQRCSRRQSRRREQDDDCCRPHMPACLISHSSLIHSEVPR